MHFFKRKPKLKKRDCGIKMKLVPYGAGWADVYLDICGDHHYFIISCVIGSPFEHLLAVLYHMYPNNNDPEETDRFVDCKIGICAQDKQESKVIEILDHFNEVPPGTRYRDIPWRASFTWNEEGAESRWTLERIADESTNFMLKIHIEHERDETKTYDYEVPYKDFCYAVAKAYTDVLKEYGLYGYHYSVFTQDLHIRYLLFLKAAALDYFDARHLTYYDEKGHGETTDFRKELELLLFDM